VPHADTGKANLSGERKLGSVAVNWVRLLVTPRNGVTSSPNQQKMRIYAWLALSDYQQAKHRGPLLWPQVVNDSQQMQRFTPGVGGLLACVCSAIECAPRLSENRTFARSTAMRVSPDLG
jgi:hypothetical protein